MVFLVYVVLQCCVHMWVLHELVVCAYHMWVGVGWVEVAVACAYVGGGVVCIYGVFDGGSVVCKYNVQ